MKPVKISLFALVLVTFFCFIAQVVEGNNYYGHKCHSPKVLLKKRSKGNLIIVNPCKKKHEPHYHHYDAHKMDYDMGSYEMGHDMHGGYEHVGDDHGGYSK
ncbi:hypothetical protein TYRP_014508 [Tyrophagus putrescentiae]|nr:hypothetical protein TYRP_014508 [Tyrophagus putrescentiae]